jgi:LmbE family N-acetylglucosaminyl deacetylase
MESQKLVNKKFCRKMNILAVGCMPLDLEQSCFGTLSRFIQNGHKMHIIIPQDDRRWTQKCVKRAKESADKIGIDEVHFIDGFDYSAVTQHNASMLYSLTKTIGPSLVIMPFWKAFNKKRRILSKTSLIACRGIGNILMYELDENIHFHPQIFFMISWNQSKVQRRNTFRSLDLTRMKLSSIPLSLIHKNVEYHQSGNKDLQPSTNSPLRSHNKKVPVEAFESHRMLLVDEI